MNILYYFIVIERTFNNELWKYDINYTGFNLINAIKERNSPYYYLRKTFIIAVIRFVYSGEHKGYFLQSSK